MNEKKQIYKYFNPNGRKWGILKEAFDEEEKEILKDFGAYLKKNNIKPKVEITINSVDRNRIINRINIYIEAGDYKLIFKNVYCGGMFGMDRVFKTLYDFEYCLTDFMGEEFDHYKDYSLSNKYRIL